jgi:hypothetical protein
MLRMPRRILSCLRVTILVLYFGLSAAVLEPRVARGEDEPPVSARHPFAPRGASHSGAGASHSGSGSWWLGTAGVALALAVAGGLSVASRRLVSTAPAGGVALRVVARTSLSPRHAVYLVRAGERVLVVGTGPQGAPALLGELGAEDLGGEPIAPHPGSDAGGAA